MFMEIERLYNTLIPILQNRIDDYEVRVQHALTVIGNNRCSLQHADWRLYNDIYDVVEEFINDGGLAINADDIDIEELMFTL